MSTYLVTGGAGFVGSHLVEALLATGEKVIVLDDLSSGSVNNLSCVRQHPRFTFLAESVSNRAALAEAADEADVIYHLAATVGVFNIIDSPAEVLSNNIGGTEAVLKAAAKKKKKVIIASTSEVYGKSAMLPFREDGDLVLGSTTNSRWSYASSKIVDEFLAQAYWRQFRVPTVIVRLFNTIGPRQSGRYGMVVPRFFEQALSGQPLSVYGTGEQSRCFTYVQDIVQWLKLLARQEKAVGRIFNLGNPEEISIRALALRILALTGGSQGITFVPYSVAYEQGFEDMERRVPSIDTTVGLTGYSPVFRLDDALALIYDWLLTEKARQADEERYAAA